MNAYAEAEKEEGSGEDGKNGERSSTDGGVLSSHRQSGLDPGSNDSSEAALIPGWSYGPHLSKSMSQVIGY